MAEKARATARLNSPYPFRTIRLISIISGSHPQGYAACHQNKLVLFPGLTLCAFDEFGILPAIEIKADIEIPVRTSNYENVAGGALRRFKGAPNITRRALRLPSRPPATCTCDGSRLRRPSH